MNYRTKASLGISGFSVHPFFGGSDSFKTPVDTYTLYKNFKFTDYQKIKRIKFDYELKIENLF